MKSAGFTLIEVLVALAIVAIALSAALKATAALTGNAQRQTEVMLAQLCAENELIKLRLSHQMPGVGDTDVSCTQAGLAMQVHEIVRPTPNPNFLRVDLRVALEDVVVYQVSAIQGRN